MAFFVLMWGAVDLASSSMGLLNIRLTATSVSIPAEESVVTPEKGDQLLDSFYQKRMLYDRLWDSLARIIISSIIFAYCRFTVAKLEKQA
jgi:hypothetical protein